MNKNAVTFDQIKMACRHVTELKEIDVTENSSIKTLRRLLEVYCKRRLPILAYFTVMGTTLLLLLNLSGYALPDVGPPIKTSQLVGLPKIQFRPDTEPPLMSGFNFGARAAQESADIKLPDTIYAKALKPQNMHLAKQRQPTNKSHLNAPHERRIATVYSHDVMMAAH